MYASRFLWGYYVMYFRTPTFENMEMKVQVPFQQLLILVKALSPTQKNRLKKELEENEQKAHLHEDDFMNFLLNGPVYTKEDISIIEDNRKSIAAWRTKN